MLKKTINYTDYEGNQVTKTLYFHLSKFEWLELETYTKGGLVENLRHSLESNNTKKTIDILKKILLRAYGERDEETGEFIKNDDLAIKFSKTEAFSELFYKLAFDENESKEFFLGLIPPEVRDEAEKSLIEEQKRLSIVSPN